MTAPATRPSGLFTKNLDPHARPIVVTGGAGFIGCNLADAYAGAGVPVRIIDNLARPGVERNLAYLRKKHGAIVEAACVDIRDANALAHALKGARAIFHFAAQVAVTTSLEDPLEDFDVNARGALLILEWVRKHAPKTPLLFASTNKVYGALSDIHFTLGPAACTPADETLARNGVDETRRLALHTPYGCSKGCADQYVLDYAHSYALRAAVLRMSCIYGPHQFGTEDQGWVAHFISCALSDTPITIYGDGRQVRDILHVSDAVDAYKRALAQIDLICGHPFNLGGGQGNAVSLNILIDYLAEVSGRKIDVSYKAPRKGDQAWFDADTRAFQAATGWRAKLAWKDGVRDLARWLAAEQRPTLERRSARA